MEEKTIEPIKGNQPSDVVDKVNELVEFVNLLADKDLKVKSEWKKYKGKK